MADVFDAVNQNTRASGSWGKKGPPKISPWPRPKKSKANEERKPVTVAELYNRFRKG